MHYLLLARFSMDDIPLRLYGNRAMAEDAAKAIDADPGLLKTKWARSLAAWPHGVSGGFVGMIVMSISESDGYPGQVTFDSTDYVPPDETALPTTATPHATATPLSAETDERAILCEASEILVKQQIALTDDIEILRRSNAELLAENNTLVATRTQLHKTISEMLEERSKWIETHVPELQGRYDQCKERVVDLEAQVWSLTSEKVSLSSKSEELQRRNVAYSRTNDELRVLNEDLNHRLNATQARASRATELEGSLRGTAQHLLGHFQKLEERTKWSLRFADDGLLPAAYCKAMQHCQRRFAEEFEGFLHTYPHVLPDIPEEYRPYDDSDDEMND